MIKKFKPIIQGVWVKSDYIDKVAKTKSPLEAMKEASGITTMVFNTDIISGDSLLVAVGCENHEGGQFTLKFQHGLFNNSLKAYLGTDTSGGFHEIGLSFNRSDTGLVLYHFDKHNKIVEKIKYIKIYNHLGDDLGDATHYIINKKIIAGIYSMKDSLGTPSIVNLTNEGTISGFERFKTYFLNIDLNSDMNDNLDEITFDLYSKHYLSYSFKINADTLNLYETYENADSTKLILGKLKYKLVRQK